MNNSRILGIQNAKFLGYYFYMNTNLWRDFQICISIPFSTLVMDLTVKPGEWIVITLILDFWFSSLKQFAYSYGILVTVSSSLPSVNKGQLKWKFKKINCNLSKSGLWNFVINKVKGRISKRVLQENKACQIFRKTNIYPQIRTQICSKLTIKSPEQYWLLC